jgi:hypothetical protein
LLFGGAGNDKYDLKTGELWDTIRDSDASGTLWVDGAQLSGGSKTSDNVWTNQQTGWTYTLLGSTDLIAAKNGERIIIRDWQTNAGGTGNYLGIDLQGAPAPAPAPAPSNIIDGT